jgi:CubicO group peptidase (beta-lactamase class C family)
MKLIAEIVATVAAAAAVSAPAAPVSTRPQTALPRQASQLAEFDDFLQGFRKKNSIPALTAVIVAGGAVLWQKAYGFSDDEGEIPATMDTTFSIASVTKPIAAIAILAEVEAGRTSLDVAMTADPDWTETCQWLASSSISFGGGGKDEHGVAIPKVDCGRELTLRDILNMRVNGPRGSGFVYNPISFARIDRMIEGAGGRPLRRIVRENVIAPAEMQDVALGWRDPDGGAALRLLAFPFIVKDGKPAVNAFGDDDFRAAGGIKASARQLATFDIAFDLGRLLSPAWQKRVWAGDLPGELGDYRWGWFVQNWKGRRLMWHSGWDEGRYSAIYLKVPDQRLTLIVLANTEALWWGNSLVRAEIDRSPIAARFLDLFVDR